MGLVSHLAKVATMKVAGKIAEDLLIASANAYVKISDSHMNKTAHLVAPKSSDVYRGMNYLEVKEELTAYGFQSIGLLPKYDLINGFLNKAGSISEITINGKSDFKAKTKFPVNSHVVITYHEFRAAKR